MGNDPFVDAAESASFRLPGTGKREGGEKTQLLQRFTSHLGRYEFGRMGHFKEHQMTYSPKIEPNVDTFQNVIFYETHPRISWPTRLSTSPTFGGRTTTWPTPRAWPSASSAASSTTLASRPRSWKTWGTGGSPGHIASQRGHYPGLSNQGYKTPLQPFCAPKRKRILHQIKDY